MAHPLPSRLLGHINGNFKVFDPRDPAYEGDPAYKVDEFDIISYTWGEKEQPHHCGIDGVGWKVKVREEKLEDIKRLMEEDEVKYLWVDCVCINQEDEEEITVEIHKMYEYYKNARKCYILMDMDEVWKPQDIVDNLGIIDHKLFHVTKATLTSEAMPIEEVNNNLSKWANVNWTFPMDKSAVRSTTIDMGVLNCYSTCIGQVRSLFENCYFSRVWTFQEMLLGKNVTMYGIKGKSIACIGELDTWMNLAADSKDKASKLRGWISSSRDVKSAAVNAILRIIAEDFLLLDMLQTQVRGIKCARTDIINGGPDWWHENHKGISNIFSAISIKPRKCEKRRDIFRGLLGVFSGLFAPEEIERDLRGDDIDTLSFAFFRQLSIKTGYAWTKLAISSGERGEWDWIPVVANHDKLLTTDCFTAVINLGRLKQKGLAKTTAMTGIIGVPRKYMKVLVNEKILPSQENRGFQFVFKGCNCGKQVKTGVFSSEKIPTDDQPKNVAKDETGMRLVQCATILGSIMDPGCDVVEYRRRLLEKLQPRWETTDPIAKPAEWIDRCVSGTVWENPHPLYFKVHNRSMNYRMGEITCESRLENESTESISCEVQVNCGCTIVAPFSLIFEAITAVEGSSLGGTSATLDNDDRIILKDGLGLVQVGDVGRAFKLVAFGGDVDSHKSYSSNCRRTNINKPAVPKVPWPKGRALVREEFSHGMTDSLRDYGYVEIGGSGNLLVIRNNPVSQYKIKGVCIDEFIENRSGRHNVTVR